ncbi:helix-turn-helix transcriptional regulator [Nocardia seriolae]|uniref:AraC family transcriptional regulator n=1 Tax=Nocardia seriolae TaxID=37332 RepID=A0ABC9Z2M8_9NOCA|nr:helix-turn-helix transcriptional regulator [Nocardia seriolae]APA98923.1 putative HTH-type transcriptional regulator in mcrB 3'region [Nocardia seriolae]OJF80433.1 AraC family transcriptional regulator [Nocardia seriolae]PSK31337.1 AraC family transcriptional regulator [Nocardia seriolae]QOW35615.1 helix-turn-helix transcriptional regulator [Nocardia seriolae]QUN16897.1 helix-turn-helix transcriptional regulator [Nocardia seriolae]
MTDIHPPQGYRERPSAIGDAVLWTRKGVSDTDLPVLPDGSMDLLWMNGRLSIAGPDTRAYRPPSGFATRITGIRFYPGTAPSLLGIPAHELRDTRIDLADLWRTAELRRANELIATAPTPAMGLEAIARWRATESTPPDPKLRFIVASLQSGAPVSFAAAELGTGPRQLHRMSLTAFGYGPKTLGRILRMQRALALAREGTALADAAATVGYSDQSHLTRDIRELSGMSPRQLLTNGNAAKSE